MKRMTFLALAMSLGLLMSAEQAGAMVANQGLAAAAANAKQTTTVTKVWWRGGGPAGAVAGVRATGGVQDGWVPFAAVGAAVAATGAYYYYNRPYYGPGPYYYGPGPYYGPCGNGPCAPPPAPIK